MKKSEITLIERMLKRTSTYKCDQIEFGQTPSGFAIWSVKSKEGAFHSTEIIKTFEELFSCYLRYNKEQERVELIIF